MTIGESWTIDSCVHFAGSVAETVAYVGDIYEIVSGGVLSIVIGCCQNTDMLVERLSVDDLFSV